MGILLGSVVKLRTNSLSDIGLKGGSITWGGTTEQYLN